jgi:hypothetical protein
LGSVAGDFAGFVVVKLEVFGDQLSERRDVAGIETSFEEGMVGSGDPV